MFINNKSSGTDVIFGCLGSYVIKNDNFKLLQNKFEEKSSRLVAYLLLYRNIE